jgi:hypothetical protein
MSRKRPTSSIDYNEGGTEVKKQKTTTHQRKSDAAVQDFLNLLGPATGDSLANFNAAEREEKRRGVIAIDKVFVTTALKRLQATDDIENLGAQLEVIYSYLTDYQDTYNSYLVTHGAVVEVRLTLRPIIYLIQEARGCLPGMFSHLDELL